MRYYSNTQRVLLASDRPRAVDLDRSPPYERESKDYDFSRQTMEDHWRTGYEDARTTLAHPEVLTLPPRCSDVAVYDFLHPRHEHEAPAKTQKGSS